MVLIKNNQENNVPLTYKTIRIEFFIMKKRMKSFEKS
jgi:hypothetical protein